VASPIVSTSAHRRGEGRQDRGGRGHLSSITWLKSAEEDAMELGHDQLAIAQGRGWVISRWRRRQQKFQLGAERLAPLGVPWARRYDRAGGLPMRLPLIPPAELTPPQKSLYDDMRKGISANFNAFKVEREDGALMGPWNAWLHEPPIGAAMWNLTMAMTAGAVLPDDVRQIAILTVGARFGAAYERYAHIAVAER
jgi:hypothetical protein